MKKGFPGKAASCSPAREAKLTRVVSMIQGEAAGRDYNGRAGHTLSGSGHFWTLQLVTLIMAF